VIATGFTQSPGGYHAEADALAKCAGLLSDVTAYVTLEPCSFHGRTPSCAEALVDRGIGRVVVALIDPDTRNNGRGLAKLRQAGVAVIEGVGSKNVMEFLGSYLSDR
jgi:pyrimidine deaminase RibD-like protein